MRIRRLQRAGLLVAAVTLAVVGLTACGGSGPSRTDTGAVVGGPGMLMTAPPWPAQYAGIKQRVAPLHLPATGKETFHTHELLHIYNDGLLVPVAKNIGVDESQDVELALHTHDSSGVIHMEADKPFRATLGDLFTVWGVGLGPDHIGGLKATADKPLTVYVNGKIVTDPAAHVLAKDDNIAIAYGHTDGVPRVPDTTALKAANGKGGTPVACSTTKSGTTSTKCFKTKKP